MPNDSAALIISHGIIAELAMLALFDDEAIETWGAAIGYCEGCAFFYDDGAIIDFKILRVSKEDYLVEN